MFDNETDTRIISNDNILGEELQITKIEKYEEEKQELKRDLERNLTLGLIFGIQSAVFIGNGMLYPPNIKSGFDIFELVVAASTLLLAEGCLIGRFTEMTPSKYCALEEIREILKLNKKIKEEKGKVKVKEEGKCL